MNARGWPKVIAAAGEQSMRQTQRTKISPFQHRRQAVPQPEGDAAQVDVEKPLPVLLVQRDEIARRLAM